MKYYGIEVEGKIAKYEFERLAFLKNPPITGDVVTGGLGRFQHFKNYCQYRYPSIEWNPWADFLLHSLCDDEYQRKKGEVETRFISWTGCATAGKTWLAGVFASIWWEMDPLNTAVVLTSTTKEAMGMRVWPVIQEMYSKRVNPTTKQHEDFGNIVNSQHRWQAEKGDDKHSILCQALQGGDMRRAVENVKGQHTKRRLIIVDESNTTSEAILAAIPNARKGCQQFIVLIIGNPFSKLDNHGRVCHPKGGWSKINVDMDKWETIGIRDHQIDGGWCFHLDGEKSPNVLAQKTIYPYLYSWEDHLHAQEIKGGISIAYWQYDRGFWANDDLKRTVITETMLDRYNVNGRFMFIGEVKKLGAADTAFGGDDPKLVFGTLGKIEDGRLALQIEKSMNMVLNAKSKDPIDYQLAQQMRFNCEKEGVLPECFGLDATGVGRGAAAILGHEWSEKIHKVLFQGTASDMMASHDDQRPGNEVYFDVSTELAFGVREALTGGVLRGIYQDAAIQLCGREYEMKGKGKYGIISKEECKKRIHRSPDDADAIAVLVYVARKLGLVGGALPGKRMDREDWNEFARKEHEQYSEDQMYQSDEIVEVE